MILETLETAIPSWSWVKDLGGWGVVCFMIWWLTQRAERTLSDHTSALRDQTHAISDITLSVKNHQREANDLLNRLIDQNQEHKHLLMAIRDNGGRKAS